MHNKLREIWAQGGVAFGGWCVLSNSHGAEIFGRAGFDYVCVDTQHGLIGYESMATMIQALNATDAVPLVRVATGDDATICRALDAGAEGVIVPMVNTADEAARAVAACRFAPEGVRSFGLMRPGLRLGYTPADVNREIVCLAMVETRRALDNLEAICATPGLDGIYVGPSDLALSLGVRIWDAPEHAEALERIRTACAAAGIVPAIHAGTGERARAFAEAGYRMATVASDGALLLRGATSELRSARERAETTSTPAEV